MTEPEVTIKDVWQLLCSMDQSLNERLDRLERHLTAWDGRLAALAARISALDVGIDAKLSALMDDK